MNYSIQRRSQKKGVSQFSHNQWVQPSEIKAVQSLKEVYEKDEFLVKVGDRFYSNKVNNYTPAQSLEELMRIGKLFILWESEDGV